MEDVTFYAATLKANCRQAEFNVSESELTRPRKLIIRQIMLGSEARVGEFNVVEVETQTEGRDIKIPIAVLKAGETRILKPNIEFPYKYVKFTLTKGRGPVYIHGQHVFNEEETSEITYTDVEDEDVVDGLVDLLRCNGDNGTPKINEKMDDITFYAATLKANFRKAEFNIGEIELIRPRKLIIRQILLGSEARVGEFNVVEAQTQSEGKDIKIPIAVLKAGETRILKPNIEFPNKYVRFTLTKGRGPVYIHGQHVFTDEDASDAAFTDVEDEDVVDGLVELLRCNGDSGY